MSLAVCLLLYAFVIVVIGPLLLVRLTRGGVAPRLGILAWCLAIVSVPLAWAAALGLLITELVHAWGQLDRLLAGCVALLGAAAAGGRGPLVQTGLLLLATLSGLALAVLLGRLAAALGRARSTTFRHADAARIVGAPHHGLGGTLVIDAPERLAYAVAGRPHTVVITRAALTALDPAQLDAVLAHEHAHLTGRHHLLVAATTGLATVAPRISLFTAGAAEIARLAEMCADDTAARGHGGRTVVSAILALTGDARLPSGALGAATLGIADRVERLLFPPGLLHGTLARLALSLAVLAPILGAAAMIAWAATGGVSCGAVLV